MIATSASLEILRTGIEVDDRFLQGIWLHDLSFFSSFVSFFFFFGTNPGVDASPGRPLLLRAN